MCARFVVKRSNGPGRQAGTTRCHIELGFHVVVARPSQHHLGHDSQGQNRLRHRGGNMFDGKWMSNKCREAEVGSVNGTKTTARMNLIVD